MRRRQPVASLGGASGVRARRVRIAFRERPLQVGKAAGAARWECKGNVLCARAEQPSGSAGRVSLLALGWEATRRSWL